MIVDKVSALYAAAHRSEPLEKLAFSLSKLPDLNARFILQQVEGWQRLRTRVPLWAETEGVLFPPRLSLEQCSSEETARYKLGIVKRLFSGRQDSTQQTGRLVDLTGGMGVDFSFLARHFASADYVEQSEELCQLAAHNLPLLGCPHAKVHCATAEAFLQEMPPASLIFLDPARRDGAGHKTVLLSQCSPNVETLLPQLCQKAEVIMLKLSPLLDITLACQQLRCVSEVHVVASGGECKELLLVLKPHEEVREPRITCAEGDALFSFSREEEAAAPVDYATELLPGDYLYEPSSALLYSGAFRLTASRFALQKLHPNTHLYLSSRHHGDFPGRVYRVKRTSGFSRGELRTFKGDVKAAGLTIRNFPSTTAALREKLHVREGGTEQWFATTLSPSRHLLIAAERVKNNP